jgi:hypothetical protein
MPSDFLTIKRKLLMKKFFTTLFFALFLVVSQADAQAGTSIQITDGTGSCALLYDGIVNGKYSYKAFGCRATIHPDYGYRVFWNSVGWSINTIAIGSGYNVPSYSSNVETALYPPDFSVGNWAVVNGPAAGSNLTVFSGTGTTNIPCLGTLSFTSGATSLCAGATSTYTATATNVQTTAYSIVGGTGATINASTGVVSNVTGDFTVRATVTGLCGAPKTVDRAVVVSSCENNGLNLDGANDYVNCGNASNLQISTGTIEAWVKTAGAGASYRGIIIKQDAYGLYLKDNELLTYYYNVEGDLKTGIFLNDNKWHHVAMSFQSGVTDGTKIYVDGELKLTTTFASTFGTTNSNYNLFLGSGGIGYGQELNGTIDEVRIWNVVRTRPQILATMNVEVMAQPGLVASYNFNHGKANGSNTGQTVLKDGAGNANTGTLTNFALTTGTTSNWVNGFDALKSNGLHFDGSNDAVNISFGNTPITAPFTIETWINPTALGNVGILGSRSISGDNSFDIQLTASGGLHADIGDGVNWLSTNADVSGGNAQITTNTWHHIAYVVTNTGYTIYINGENKGSGSFSGGTPLLTDAVRNILLGATGSLYASQGYNFNGIMDEVRIWNVARTQNDIKNNIGNAVEPQTGLLARYSFNQGIVIGVNTGLVKLLDVSGNNRHGTLENFALSGTTSNWANGFYLPSKCNYNLPTANRSLSQDVTDNTFKNECELMAVLSPSGTSPVSGMIGLKTWIQSGSFSYVKRNYEITPTNNPNTATGTVTLYFTQADFNAYNALNAIKLPQNPTDEAGKTNIIIYKYSGSSSNNSGSVASYSGVPQAIVPGTANIVWNVGSSYWEITFSVTGFSGFMIGTSAAVLPISLLSFEGTKIDKNENQLLWKTTDETNASHFDIERSVDGKTFEKIGKIKTKGSNSSYDFNDKNLPVNANILYYRLKMNDLDGTTDYSKTIAIASEKSGSIIKIYPTNTEGVVWIDDAGLGIDNVSVFNAVGQLVLTLKGVKQIDLSAFNAGMYIIHVDNQEGKTVEKVFKQ